MSTHMHRGDDWFLHYYKGPTTCQISYTMQQRTTIFTLHSAHARQMGISMALPWSLREPFSWDHTACAHMCLISVYSAYTVSAHACIACARIVIRIYTYYGCVYIVCTCIHSYSAHTQNVHICTQCFHIRTYTSIWCLHIIQKHTYISISCIQCPHK